MFFCLNTNRSDNATVAMTNTGAVLLARSKYGSLEWRLTEQHHITFPVKYIDGFTQRFGKRLRVFNTFKNVLNFLKFESVTQ
jgi:hypothetical protein